MVIIDLLTFVSIALTVFGGVLLVFLGVTNFIVLLAPPKTRSLYKWTLSIASLKEDLLNDKLAVSYKLRSGATYALSKVFAGFLILFSIEIFLAALM